MPHPLLLGALASVVRATDPAAAHAQDLVPRVVASTDSTGRAAPPVAPAGTPAGESTSFGASTASASTSAPTSAPTIAPSASVAPTATSSAASSVGSAAAPAASFAPATARAAVPASASAAALPYTPRAGTAPPPVPRLASAARLPTLVSVRARYRSADPYVAGRSDLIDSIVVEKGARKLALFRRGALVRAYDIALGGQPAGHKMQRGDKRTPEGLYYIESRNPNSRYHLALRISYPNAYDLWRSRALGVPPGGDIMIHGLPNGQGYVGEAHRQDNWTEGCIAVTDQEIEQIWSTVPVGTPILIKP